MAKAVIRFSRDEVAPLFVRPDLRRLSRDLDLQRRAANGQSDTLLSDIAAKCANGAAQVRQETNRVISEAEARARAQSVQALDVDRFVSTAELDLATTEARLFEPLVHARLEERRRLRELRRFKLDHNLERDASYAESALQPAANLALLIAAESAANALLLQTASPGGYVGGFLIAVIMSLITVAMGALFAGLLGIRLMRRQNVAFRVLGGAIFTTAVLFAALWAYALARYRDAAMVSAAGLSTGAGKKDAAAHYTTGLFGPADGPVLGFGSLESLALVVLGVVVFALATMKGAGGRGGFTDSYWGYKPRHAAHRSADEAYQDEQEDYLEALEDIITEAKQTLDAAADEADRRALGSRARCDQGISALPLASAALHAWKEAEDELRRRAGAPPKAAAFHDAPDAAAIQVLYRLRDEADAQRSADAAAANAARRTLKDRLDDAQSRLAQRIAAAEQEADRRLAEELTFLRAGGGQLV